MQTKFKTLAASVASAAALAGLALAPSTASADPGQPASPPDTDMHTNIVGGHAPTQPWPAGAKAFVTFDAPDYGAYDKPVCGASQYSGQLFLSAAHCGTPMPPGANKAALAARYEMNAADAEIPFSAKRFKIRVGSDKRDSGGVVVEVVPFWHSPKWNWGQTPGDEFGDALLFRSKDYVDTYALPIAPRPARPGDTVYQLGFGRTEHNGTGPLPTQIRESKTTILPKSRCAPAISGREVCTNNPGGTTGPCYGDSGSPLGIKIDGVMYNAGITSRGFSPIGACGDTPGIYTSAPDYAKEIAAAATSAPRPTPPPGRTTGVPVN